MRPVRIMLLAMGISGLTWIAWASLPEPEPPPGLALPALSTSLTSVDRVELRQGSVSLTLERRGQLWFLAQHGGYPANSGRVFALLDHLAGMRLLRRAPETLETLGLDDPLAPGSLATQVRILTVAGHVVGALVLGKLDGGRQYVRHPVDFEAWIADQPLDRSIALAGWTDPLVLPPGLPAPISATLERTNEADAALTAAAAATFLGVQFDDVQSSRQIRPQPAGAVHTVLEDGTMLEASLDRAEGRTWLRWTATGPLADSINRRVGGWSYAIPTTDTPWLAPPGVAAAAP